MKRIAIVGGGIAGVAAAYELARMARDGAAMQVVLFEASTRLGGIVETVREGGFVMECGPDAWVTEKPWARELAEELGLGDEVMASNDATRKTYVLIDNQLQAMPDGMRMMVPSESRMRSMGRRCSVRTLSRPTGTSWRGRKSCERVRRRRMRVLRSLCGGTSATRCWRRSGLRC